MNYYIISCRSGREDTVKAHLDRFFSQKEEAIVEVVIPKRTMIDRRRGRPLQNDHPILPGYILLSSNDSLTPYIQDIRNLYASYGFLKNLDKSIALKGPDYEYAKWIRGNGGVIGPSKVVYTKGEPIKVIDGPMKDFMGTIIAVDYRRARVKVEFEFDQVIRRVDLPVEFISNE